MTCRSDRDEDHIHRVPATVRYKPKQTVYWDYWVVCPPCGIDQRCPSAPEQSKFVDQHLRLGHDTVRGKVAAVYAWPPVFE